MTTAKFRASNEVDWTEKFIQDNGIKAEHVEFIVWNEQYFLNNSRLPTFEESEQLQIDLETWQKYWKNNSVRNCLMTRGVPLRHPEPLTQEQLDSLPDAVLSGPQLECINVLTDPEDMRPDHKKLKDLGIRNSLYQKWRTDPTFKEYYDKRAHKLVKDLTPDAMRAFADNVREGDMGALKMYFEMTGIYRANDPQTVQFRMLLQRVIDAIQIEVKDPETLNRLSNRITGVIEDNTKALPPAIDKSITTIETVSNNEALDSISSPVGGLDF